MQVYRFHSCRFKREKEREKLSSYLFIYLYIHQRERSSCRVEKKRFHVCMRSWMDRFLACRFKGENRKSRVEK
jgi:hypothetical protein